MSGNSFVRIAAAAALAFTLTACKSSEERAQEHYESAIALLERGETDKAIVEFRNVFKLDGQHREARETFAKLMRDRGRFREAYGQYLRLVEQYPDDAEGRIALAEMSFLVGNWDEFDRHAAKAIELAPDDPRAKVIGITADYRNAILAKDTPAQQAAVEKARLLGSDQTDNPLLLRLLIEGAVRDGRYTEALSELDRAISQEPENRLFYEQKLAVLTQLADYTGIETQLRLMIDTFPDDATIKGQLIRFFMSRGQIDEAEAFLRSISDPDAEAPDLYLALIQFLIQQRGADAALAELNSAIDRGANPLLLRTVRAGIAFEQGGREKAIADLEDLLANAGEDDDLSKTRVALARMLLATGNEVGARRQVEEALADDPAQVDALKMQAAWQIDADQTDQAIATLRTVLDNAPEDAAAMTLMAQAYSRAGNKDLARDFLSLAVETSRNAPAESVRYARELLKDKRYLPAESTLISALRAAPGNALVLRELGNLYLEMEDFARAQQVVDTLRRIGSDEANGAANAVEASLLAKREGPDEAISFLEKLAEQDNSVAAQIAVIRGYLSTGQGEQAIDYVRKALAENPDNAVLKYALHSTQAATGDVPGALAGYREMVTADPGLDKVWLEMARLYLASGDQDAATKAINDGLAAKPDSPELLWAKATYLERAGDIDGAIAIYEDLYSRMSGAPIVANNLASLLSVYRSDEASLERAYVAAKRLNGTTFPPFQDTYGWILLLRGQADEALTYLEPAAEALPTDPMVQYHLAKTYQALGREEDALARFRAAVEAAGDVDTRPEIEEARAALRGGD